jgi:anti-anti-sigma regulatory factor
VTNPKFQTAVHQRDDVTYLKIGGVIDEDNELGQLAEKLATATAVIDLSEIERINSCGVRDWVNWLGLVEKAGARIVLVECSPAIVAQINLVNNFTGTGVVKSFYAPYFCPNCDLEKVLLVETRDLGSANGAKYKAPTCRCDECDGVMDFDDMEDSYFAFLANASKIVSDARVDAVVSEFTPSDPNGQARKLRGKGSNPQITPQPASPAGAPQSSGSIPSLPSLAASSMPRTPPPGMGQLPSSSQKWPLYDSRDLSRPAQLTPQSRSAGAWILVAVLVATAFALLAYVLLAGPGRPSIPAG